MKCRPQRCKAQCCYNIPFDDGELEKYADKIINPVLITVPLGPGHVAFTVMPKAMTKEAMGEAMKNNKCPFLKHDCTCNIYEHRPDVCRKFGEIPELPCEIRKK